MRELEIRREGQIAVVTFRAVTLARPFIAELSQLLNDLESDETVRAILFTGQRSVFMTGADRHELSQLHDEKDVEDFLAVPHDLVLRFLSSRKLLAAAINGYCLGGGLEFALSCDLRTCASDLRDSAGPELAFIGLPEVSVGMIPACGGAYLAFRTVGLGMARRLLLTAAPVSATEALQMGLVDRVYANEVLVNETVRWMSAIVSQSTCSALVETKKLLNAPVVDSLQRALRHAVSALKECCECGDKDRQLARVHEGGCRLFKADDHRLLGGRRSVRTD